MQIFVINLKHAPDRFAKIEAQLNALGLPFTLIEAIDGKSVDANDSCIDPYRFRLNQRREIRDGEIGCAESHRKAWKAVLEMKQPYTLILEDDACPPESLPDILQSIENFVDLDIINFSSNGSYPINQDKLNKLHRLGLKSRPFLKNKLLWKQIEANRWKIFMLHQLKNFTLCECAIMPPFMSAYVVTPKACRALLRATNNCCFPIDYAYRFTAGKIRQAFSFPVFIHQNTNFESSIGNRENQLKLSLKESLLRFFFKKRRTVRSFYLVLMYRLKQIL